MALCGLRPVVYTIAPFATTRCLEQIRVDVCYHNAPVTIVGVGAGLSYASLGATHHSCEDIAFLRTLPGMTVVCPADACEVRLALAAAIDHPSPVYLRLGKKGETAIHAAPPDFRIGRAITLRAGAANAEVALVCTGNMAPTALAAADLLAAQNAPIEVVNMHTVKPLDETGLAAIFSRRSLVVTLEEHSRLAGLGGAVAEWLADRRDTTTLARLLRIGCPDEFFHECGEQEFARQRLGLDAEGVAATILTALGV
jgi:transketolase